MNKLFITTLNCHGEFATLKLSKYLNVSFEQSSANWREINKQTITPFLRVMGNIK